MSRQINHNYVIKTHFCGVLKIYQHLKSDWFRTKALIKLTHALNSKRPLPTPGYLALTMDKVDRPIDAMLKDVARSLPATQVSRPRLERS